MSTTKPNIFTAKFKITGSGDTATATIDKSGTTTIYEIEQAAFNELNNFNTNYALYLRCTPGLGLRKIEIEDGNITGTIPNPVISTIMDSTSSGGYYHNKEGCNGSVPSADRINNIKNNLKEKVNIYTSAIAAMNAYNGTFYEKLSKEQYIDNYNYIKSTHDDIITKRNIYDAKLKELTDKEGLNKDDSPWDAAIQREQEMMFVGTTGAILASALIYYIFSKL